MPKSTTALELNPSHSVAPQDVSKTRQICFLDAVTWLNSFQTSLPASVTEIRSL